MSFYNTIEQDGMAEFKDRGSRFLAYAFPFRGTADLKKFIHMLKKEHPKAVHFCFAYRLGTDGNNFRSSDDGEPSGSAGKPMLGQIDSKGLTDVLLVTVRYFGGSLLGVPGLINAYKSAAAMALQVVPAVKKPVLYYCTIRFEYDQKTAVLQLLKKYGCEVISQQNDLFPEIKAGIPEERRDECIYALKNCRNVEISTLL
jgi:uncharacterized YigZ family protein